MSAKRQFGIRLRADQQDKIDKMIADDPELDRSKIIRKAIDEYLSRVSVSENGSEYRTGKKGSHD